ncbi:hypothetical protein H0H87_007816 [Tephrocybe sp. NHM501043]|nr:hypothetical protein H0H87_007816 [Tephrocybe sp. NHM501043]
MQNQQNPPPPPLEDTERLPSPVRTVRPLPDPLPSPIRTPRPLPDPQLQPQHHPQSQALRATNGDPLEEDEEYMNIDANFPGLETGYLTEGLGRGRTPRPTPVSPSTADLASGRGRNFVGGFVNGLRRLPRVVLSYRSFGEKRKYFRRATFGSGGTLSNGTDMTTGNTLPLYASNPPTPVAGPSASRYVESIEMPVAHPADVDPPPVILGPSLSQRRRHPSFRVTPPSEEVAEQEAAELAPDTAQTTIPVPLVSNRASNVVTIYNLPGQEGHEEVEDPPMPVRIPTPNQRSASPHQESLPASSPAEALPQSPVLVHPPPAADYRKMTSSPRSPTTLTTSFSSVSSFSSELHPVKNFFVKLYHLPWIAHERVTADYRPGSHRGNHGLGGGIKRPMSSWYRGKPGLVLSPKSGSGDVDLLSSGDGSRRASGVSSLPVPSPALHTRRRSTDHSRSRHREHRRHTHDDSRPTRSHEHRSRHRRNTTSTAEIQQPNRGSPMIPAVYPYPYPYPIQYASFSSQPPQRAQSHSTPRGPRPHRTPTYPHGYAPYQPPQPPPPVFVMHSPTQTSSSGEASHVTNQIMSPVFVPMQLVPGAFTQEPIQATASPPAAEADAAGDM